MALVFVVAALKGGVGKSTLTLNLATHLHRSGHRTLIVDTDAQGTCRTWASKAAEAELEGPPVVAMDGKALRRDLERVAEGFKVVIVDTPPRLSAEVKAVMLAADLVICPVTPGAGEVWALQQTLDVLEEVRALRPELRAVVVANRTDRTSLASLIGEAISELGVPVLKATLGNRVAFGEATLAGQAVVDYAPSSPAALEVKKLTAAVLAAVKE